MAPAATAAGRRRGRMAIRRGRPGEPRTRRRRTAAWAPRASAAPSPERRGGEGGPGDGGAGALEEQDTARSGRSWAGVGGRVAREVLGEAGDGQREAGADVDVDVAAGDGDRRAAAGAVGQGGAGRGVGVAALEERERAGLRGLARLLVRRVRGDDREDRERDDERPAGGTRRARPTPGRPWLAARTISGRGIRSGAGSGRWRRRGRGETAGRTLRDAQGDADVAGGLGVDAQAALEPGRQVGARGPGGVGPERVRPGGGAGGDAGLPDGLAGDDRLVADGEDDARRAAAERRARPTPGRWREGAGGARPGASREALRGSTRECCGSVPKLCRNSVRAVRAPDGVDRPAARAEHGQPDEGAEAAGVPHAAGGDQARRRSGRRRRRAGRAGGPRGRGARRGAPCRCGSRRRTRRR